MALIIKDRVKEITTTTGTGAVSLGGASATFDAFQSVMSNGDTTFYAIVHTTSGVDQWEVGIGTWNTGNTLTRTTIISGSSNTSAVNFSSGTKDIFMTYPASKTAVAGEDITFADVTATDITSTGTVTLSADPSSALQAATKQYVDTIAAAGIHYHTPVRVEHPSNLNATYNNGSSGVGATLTNAGTNAALVLDNVSMVLNDRVLVANQTDQTQNGVYTVTTVGDGSTAWVLTRSTDTDTAGPSDPDAFGKGDAFFIKEGDTNAGHLDVLTTTGTIVFGTTNIVFSEVAETSIYAAGAGLSLTGTTFAVDLSYLDNRYFTESEADSRFVNVSGDTMSGQLAIIDNDGGQPMLQVRNHSTTNTGAFTDSYTAEIRGSTSGSQTHGMLINLKEANDSRRTLDIGDLNGIFASFVNGKVGIGISSGLTYPLTIKEDTNNSYIHFVNSTTGTAFSDGTQIGVPSGSTDLIINNRENANTKFYTANTERMRIDSIGDLTVKGGRIFVNESDNGNTAVGITRDADEGYVQVYSAGSITTSIRGNGDSYFNGGNIGIGTSSGFGGKLDITLSTNARGYFSDSISEVGSGNFALQVVNSAGSALKPLGFRAEDIRFATGSSERMRIDSSGRVLIGQSASTGSANADELVVGSGSGNQGITIFSGASNGSTLAFKDSSADEDGFISFNHSSQFMQFGTAATERMRLDSSGHVSVGRTAPVSGLASYTQLTVSGPEGGISINSTDTTTGDYSRLMFTKSGSTGNEGLIRYNTGNYHMSFWTNATERMRIDSSGLVDIGSNSTASAGASKQLLSLVNPSGTANTAARLWMSGTNSTSRGTYIEAEAQSTGNDHDLIFATSASGSAPSERMRIDSSGNLLVSKNTTSVATAGVAISSSQGVRSTVDGNVPVLLNRLSDDGNLIDFRKDGTVVGVIGTSGGDLLIRSSATSHGGLRFGEGYIFPVNNNGATSDGAIDLGISSSVGRFRNLFLSGAVNAAQFYDINNTSYYLDPAATGTALNVNGTIAINNGGSSNTHGLKFTGSNSRIWFHGYRTLEGSTDGNNLQVGEGFSYTTILNQTRSPIFYDSDNTAYFINPSATNDSAKFRQHVSIGDGSASANSGSWGARLNLTDQVHSRIDVQQDANSMIGTMYVHTGHAGPRIGSSTAHPMYMMYNGGGVGFWDTNQLKHDSSVRAPVFYDTDNTSYYVNPASTSLLSDLRVGGGRTGRTFTLANTGSASKWIKLGNFAAAQDGRSVFINVVTNSGYNASDAQNSQVEIRFKTSNNSTNQSGFYGDVQAYKTGPNATPSVVRVVQQSTTSFDIWCSFGTFTGGGSFYTVYQDAGTWTHSGTTTTTAPTGTYVDAAIRTMWHSGNDGSGSGLDADLLDGVHGSSFLRSDTADTASGDITFTGGAGAISVGAGSDLRFTTGNWTGEHAGKIQYHSSHFYFQGADQFIFRTAAGANNAYIENNGRIQSVTDIRAPIFYDRNDTTYYTNPASNSVMNQISLGAAGNGSNTKGRFISLEGNTDSSGEGSGRIFFAEHNSTTSSMDAYGMSIGYRGGATSITGVSGNSWTGLSQIGNGQWGMWGHDGNATGALIMYGDRAATYVNFAANDIQNVGTLTATTIRAGDGNDGYFFSDNNGRTAFDGGDFYIKSGVGNCYLYATNTYLGPSSGSNIYTRGNTISGDSWSITGAGVGRFQGGSNVLDIGNSQTEVDINYRQANSTWQVGVNNHYGNGSFFFYRNGSNYRAGLDTSGNLFAEGSSRAPIFYDKDNTAYYVDPNSTSSMWNVNIRGDASSTATGNQIFFWGNSSSTTSAIGFKANGGNFTNPTGSGDGYNTYLTMDTAGRGWVFRQGTGGTNFSPVYTSGWILNNGLWQANGSMRAPIFYDKDNTAYYANPASDSKFNNLDTYNYVTVGGGANAASNNPYSSVSSTRLMFGSRDSNAQGAYYIGTNMENYGGNYTKLDLRWHTGIRMGAQQSYGGVRIFDSEGLGTVLFAVAQGDTHVRATNNFYAKSFYDIDNTSYYFDGSATGDSIRCAGDIVAYYSDERLKDIEGNIDTPLEKVSKLNGFYYVANKKARELGYKADRQVGVSAQEVEAVMPEIVKDAAIGHGYKTVDYAKLVPLLIEAVKEQQKLIEELYKKFDEID